MKGNRKWFWLVLGVSASAVLLVSLGLALFLRRGHVPLAKAQLADGRILQVEAVTFGSKHAVGGRSVLESFSPWLPRKIADLFSPKYPRSEITLDRDALVVWVNAMDPVTGKPVDCQGIRVELVDQNGDLFGQATSSWTGFTSFWRVGHVFYAFPRTERKLTLLVTPWRTNAGVRMTFRNPHVVKPAAWVGRALPQRAKADDLEIVLAGLRLGTNGDPKEYWQTRSRYWEPAWELRRNEKPVTGWEAPEWTCEDATGNHGQYLGLHQPVLRYSAVFYPQATNNRATVVAVRSPPANFSSVQSNLWWGIKTAEAKNRMELLGLFPAGVQVFLGGEYQTNPAVKMRAVRGGAPSGWVGQSQRVSPVRVQHWDGHYSDVPVIYVHAAELEPKERLGVRLRDAQGHYWAAKPESQGHPQGVYAFMIEPAAEAPAEPVVAEVVVLRPVEASFMVDTSGGGKR